MADEVTNPTALGELPTGWTVSKIADLCARITSGGTPLRSNPKYFIGGTIPWYKTQELQGWYVGQPQERITESAIEETSAKILPARTILMAMYGDGKTITSLGILPFEAACNQACCALIANQTKCDYRFLFYALRHHRADFIHIATGGAQRNLSGALIRNFCIKVPPLRDQAAIGAMLEALDSKIELNHRTNETLENIARAIFKSWFVDFDPVRAKAEGRQPAGMDTETAALFPDVVCRTPLGDAPDGWEIAPFAKSAEIVSGGTPKTSIAEYWRGDIPWFSIADAPDAGGVYIIQTEKRISSLGLANSAAVILPENCTIISARGTIGKCGLVGVPMAFNQSCYGLLPTGRTAPFFLFFSTLRLVSVLQQRAHGSVFNTITRDTFGSVEAVLPSTPVILRYDCLVAPMLGMIKKGLEQNRNLAKLRDTLLPKLLSGEVRIRDAEKAVEAVV